MIDTHITRGSVWWADLPNWSMSSVQIGKRPVVVVSSPVGISTTDLVMVVPLTTKIKQISVNADLDFEINLGVKQQALGNQIMVIPQDHLFSFMGNLPEADLARVEDSMLIALGLKHSEKTYSSIAKNETLEDLVPEARRLVLKLTDLLTKSGQVDSKPQGRVKRSSNEVREFIKEWEASPEKRKELATKYSFNSYNSAYHFWRSHRERVVW